MMRQLRVFNLVVMIAVLFVSQAAGQNRRRQKGKYEVSLALGASVVGDERFPTSTGGGVKEVGIEFDTGYDVAFRITDNFSKWVGAELEYDFSDHDFKFLDLTPSLTSLPAEQRLHALTYSAVLYPAGRSAKIRPFAVAGAGATYFQIGGDDALALANNIDLKSRWEFVLNFGGGVKWMLDEQWGLRFDLRNRFATVPDYGLPRQDVDSGSGVVPGFRPRGDFRHWTFSVGFTYVIKSR